MKFQQERIEELIPELLPLLELHYRELTLHQDVVKLAPKWADYITLDAMGRLAVLTAREDSGLLVGYNIFFINTHMHYADLMVAVNDVFYIRGTNRPGPLALRFLRYTETALKGLGARKLAYHTKYGNNFARILRRMGYSDEEAVLGKIL